jgi:uncharacterized membrane protein
MEFVLWSARVVHVLSAIVWIGGLIYANAILNPVLEHERITRQRWMQFVNRRMMGYVWFTVWPLLLTGTLLMLLHASFRWGEYGTTFNRLLALKQALFLLMLFFSWQTKKVFERMNEPSDTEETFEGWRLASLKLLKRTIFTGILALLAAEGMRSF